MRHWLILGSGAVSRECYLPAFRYLNALADLTVVDLAVSGDLRKRYPQVEFAAGDFDRFLDSSHQCDATAAIVTLPNRFHENAVLRALEKGMHVLCEKPLALTQVACQRMRESAVSAKRLLAVNMIRRLFPSIRTVVQMVRDGQIGSLISVTMEHGGPFSWPAQSLAPFLPENGGVFADMGVHYLDMAEMLVGPLELRSYRDDFCGGVEADATADLVSGSGTTVRIHVSRLCTLANKITFLGTEGRIVLGVDSFSEFDLYRPVDGDGVRVHPVRPFPSLFLPVSLWGCFAWQVQRFESRIAGGDVSTEESESAARSARIIEQAYCARNAKLRARNPAPVALEPAPALITGATGFIGARLIERLVECGVSDLACIIRRPQTCALIARFPVSLIPASLLDFEAVRKAVHGRRYVFHLAYGRDGSDAEAITLRGTENIVNAAIESGCEAVVILSTINVMGWPDGEINETAPYRPAGGSYGKTKAVMERWCLKAARGSGGTRIVVLLPSCVYGPGGKTFTELPAKLAGDHAFAWISNGQGVANYVFIDNLIDALFKAISSPRAHGQRFIINDGWTTWREFLTPIVSPWEAQIRSYEPGELGRILVASRRGALTRALRAAASNADVRRELKHIPLSSVARRLALKVGLLTRVAQVDAPSPPDAQNSNTPPMWLEDLFGTYRTRFSSAKAHSLLEWTPRVKLEEGQQISVEYLKAVGLRHA
jgi:nucleoside-diphosphate-sugar epimerase/predicted dehydrogenase